MFKRFLQERMKKKELEELKKELEELKESQKRQEEAMNIKEEIAKLKWKEKHPALTKIAKMIYSQPVKKGKKKKSKVMVSKSQVRILSVALACL